MATFRLPGGRPQALAQVGLDAIKELVHAGLQALMLQHQGIAHHHPGQLVVTVDDDGPGIPEDMREDVFKPFVRLDSARNQDASGTGLGLSIARDIARSHGGDIELSDSPMGGLRATIRVPA